MPVQVTAAAPPFEAPAYLATEDAVKTIALDQYEDRWLCLFFYSTDFGRICPTEVAAFAAAHEQFQQRHCGLLGCSCDTVVVHRAWCAQVQALRGLPFPLLADVTKRIAMDYGVLLPQEGIALRGTFLIGPDGVLRWMSVHDKRTGRGIEEVLRSLDALQTGRPCPCDWQPGQATLGQGED